MKNSYEKVVDILRIEAEAIAIAASRIEERSVEAALSALSDCTGKIIVIGVGKSGVIGEKIAQTLSSTGAPAIFVRASDALHGGLGVLASGDVVIALSNSGETDEILALIPTLKRRSVTIIAISGNNRSTLAGLADIVLDASVDKEACPLNLAPTTSTTVALAIGDALAMTLMESKGLTPEDFAANHPAGRLGKRLTLTVGDLMHPSPNVSPGDGWLEVVKAISEHSLGAVNVVSESRELMGIVTDGDLRRTIERTKHDELASLTADKMMTSSPISAKVEMLAYEALRLMEDRASQISVLPVIDDQAACVGLLRLHDIVRAGL